MYPSCTEILRSAQNDNVPFMGKGKKVRAKPAPSSPKCLLNLSFRSCLRRERNLLHQINNILSKNIIFHIHLITCFYIFKIGMLECVGNNSN